MKKVYVKPNLNVVDLRPEEQIGRNCYNNANMGEKGCTLKPQFTSAS